MFSFTLSGALTVRALNPDNAGIKATAMLYCGPFRAVLNLYSHRTHSLQTSGPRQGCKCGKKHYISKQMIAKLSVVGVSKVMGKGHVTWSNFIQNP